MPKAAVLPTGQNLPIGQNASPPPEPPAPPDPKGELIGEIRRALRGLPHLVLLREPTGLPLPGWWVDVMGTVALRACPGHGDECVRPFAFVGLAVGVKHTLSQEHALLRLREAGWITALVRTGEEARHTLIEAGCRALGGL